MYTKIASFLHATSAKKYGYSCKLNLYLFIYQILIGRRNGSLAKASCLTGEYSILFEKICAGYLAVQNDKLITCSEDGLLRFRNIDPSISTDMVEMKVAKQVEGFSFYSRDQ